MDSSTLAARNVTPPHFDPLDCYRWRCALPLFLFFFSVTVLGRTVMSVAMCSFYWIVMFLLLAVKYVI